MQLSAKMNLGDGLMFELENGKPRLILSNHHGVDTKNPNKILSRTRPQNALNSNKFPEPVSEEPLRVQRKRAERRKAVPITNTVPVKNDTPMVASNHTKPKAKGSTDHNTKAVAKVPSAKGHRQIATDRPPKTTVKDSLVCLTNEQLQQILSTINNSTISLQDQDVHSQPQTGNAGNSKEDCLLNGTGREGSAAHVSGNGNSHGKREDERWMIGGVPSGLFSSLGEREMDKEALEAKRTQWRKELDEQMALKKQQKDLSRPDVTADYGPRGRMTSSSKPGPGDGHMHARLQMQEVSLRLGGPGLEDTDTQSYSSHRDLPSAIRSAFIVGEATPVEHAFSAQKKEQHRRWLQDLDQQREEDKLRHRQEKQYLSQAEDHERWAMHFDSPQMRVPLQAPVAAERGESEHLSSLSHQRTASGALSVAWDGASTYGGESLGRASVDTTGGFPQKASHLRTMTALLDPAQIEERERKRLKQLEHQRAIEAQVEERRRQREVEEAVHQAVEQEEERRVVQERELLQRQYQLDTQRKRHKEEQHSRKQEELYLSVQRAQEEALKDKHQQRIRELARKGHDVSKLHRSLEGEPDSSWGPYHYQTGREMDTLIEETCSTTTSLRKDTAVQTEVNTAVRPGCTYTVEALGNRSQAVQTPDIPVEYKPPPNSKSYRREARQETRLAQRNPPGPGAGKENVWLNNLEGGGGEGGDLYEAFARTDRGQGQRHRGGSRRPEWNTQRPSKPYVPASERYPAGLQHTRQESRLRRQMELMTLMERNTRTPHPHDPEPADPLPPHVNYTASTTQGRIKNAITGVTHAMAVNTGRVPPRSPPVPAIKHRLQNQSHGSRPPTQAHGSLQDTDSPPPPSDYVPYLRTDEVYHMDPRAPISRPSTHPQQQSHTDAVQCRPISPPHQKDPLLHPELLRNTERQQAILKSLSKLRQGLLQKQKELETGLNPLLIVTEDHHGPPLQHVTHSLMSKGT